MNPRKYMIVDLDKKGDKRMFITEQVERISLGKNGLWSVVFYDTLLICLFLTYIPFSSKFITKGFTRNNNLDLL